MSKLKKRGGTNKFGTVKNKIIFVGVGLLVIAIGIVIILRFSTPQDTWVCTENGWIKQGNPKTVKPKDECVIPVSSP
jgi:hypothetical protein